PSRTGTRGSLEPMRVISFPRGSNKRRARNTSASAVSEEIHNLTAIGPVISVLAVIGGGRKGRPSPLVSYTKVTVLEEGSWLSASPSGCRKYFVHRVRASGHSFSSRRTNFSFGWRTFNETRG